MLKKERDSALRPKGYWSDVGNQRRFFIQFAEAKGFDPYDWAQWEKVSRAQIKANVRSLNFLFFSQFFFVYDMQGPGLLKKFEGTVVAMVKDLLQVPEQQNSAP